MCVPWELNPQPFALLTQCSTTEPQEHEFEYVFYNLYKTSITSHYNDLIKKTEQTQSKRSSRLTRRLSPTLHGAADLSLSSITYILISKDCFICNANVFSLPLHHLHLQNSSRNTFPKRKQPQRSTGDAF